MTLMRLSDLGYPIAMARAVLGCGMYPSTHSKMSFLRNASYVLGMMLSIGLGSNVRGEGMRMQIPPGDYTRQLGSGSLDDPSGVAHTRKDATNQVIVAIFSIPNMSQGSYQEKWANLLAHQSDTRLPKSVFLVLFEDMAHAGMFKGIARSDLKQQFTKGSRPLVVLDETGDIFKKYGVPRDKTEILIYDKSGVLRDVEQDLNDTAATAHRIHAITAELQAK